MRRRSAVSDPGFGSDSFLDVLSNIVGILIILIVMAGMQLSRTPLPSKGVPSTTPDSIAVVDSDAEEEPSADDSPTVAVAEPPSLPDLEQPPADLARSMAELAQERRRLEEEDRKAQAALAELLARHDDAQTELASVNQGAVSHQQELKDKKHRLQALKREIGEKREKLSGLLADFEEVETSQPAAKTIKHRLTPVSQEVTGEELHFRLSGGRVSFVPLTELLERVKQQVERRRDLAAARGGYKGIVGPIEGYSLEFVIETRRMTPHEERANGMREGYSLELSRCMVISDPNYQGETVEEALKRGSRFAMALRTASSGAALTFWTYPDSFAQYRKLQEAGHAEGFLVAGRPLPYGQNIMGDRKLGTKSAGQ